jgi:hypothetical protein
VDGDIGRKEKITRKMKTSESLFFIVVAECRMAYMKEMKRRTVNDR